MTSLYGKLVNCKPHGLFKSAKTSTWYNRAKIFSFTETIPGRCAKIFTTPMPRKNGAAAHLRRKNQSSQIQRQTLCSVKRWMPKMTSWSKPLLSFPQETTSVSHASKISLSFLWEGRWVLNQEQTKFSNTRSCTILGLRLQLLTKVDSTIAAVFLKIQYMYTVGKIVKTCS